MGNRQKIWFEWSQYILGDKSQPHQLKELSVRIEADIFVGDYFEANSIPVVSEKVKNLLLAEVPEYVDFFPIQAFHHGKKITKDSFFIMYIKEKTDCFDWKKSVYRTSILNNGEKSMRSIHKLVLLEDNIKDKKIVRVAEVGFNIIAVREDLCQIILNSGAKGIEFKELSQTLW
ncbi:Imm43 family immunity protein [Rivularia sp. UHCC 0363]|uniref:Imm43 family immunity protein n=1 Tax=Rivularia sp. UHCC 0363 TaxID=3110244 RepID=UPI002B212AA0|nr:DUF1629 domain-containing protein [Rivularia sp. UHCC 0363]MEA5595150.1 DUF1629 domain-containing protein [Rivularia sp. UHCC 0363]